MYPPVYQLGRAHIDAGDLQAGIDLLERSLIEEGGHVTTHQILAQAYLKQGKLRPALHHIQLVVRAQPENMGARITLCTILIQAGHPQFARHFMIRNPDGSLPKRFLRIVESHEKARKEFGV